MKMVRNVTITKDEQQEIWNEYDELLKYFESNCKTRKWNRFRGSAYSRIITKKLEPHLPSNVKCVMSAWVEGCPNEFDILIVDKDAEPQGSDPQGFALSYAKNAVHLIIEVKGAGVYYPKKDIESKMKELYLGIKERTEKPVLFLSVHGRDYVKEMVQNAWGKENVFFLNINGKGPQSGAWHDFLKKVNEILG